MVTLQTKAEFRAQAHLLRAEHAADVSLSFLSVILELPCFARASSVAAFIPFGVEPQTADIIGYCHAQGKRVGVPAWIPETKDYQFCDYPCGSVLTPAHLGIVEPFEKSWRDATAYDLILIPGLLFDRRGTRLGHGKGYYDRILAARTPSCKLVALAFDWQISEETLPQDTHDVPMDVILTPSQIVTC